MSRIKKCIEALKKIKNDERLGDFHYGHSLLRQIATEALASLEKNKTMDKIPTQGENPKGLHARYYIQKIVRADGTFDDGDTNYKLIPVDKDSEYFVMRLDEGGKDLKHIAACRIGVHAYADAIADYLPELAKDLKNRYPLFASLEKDEDERYFEEILDYYNVTLEDNRRDESIRLAAFKYASQFKK